MFQLTSYAAFWNKQPKEPLGNTVNKEEYPASKDVEPTINETENTILIKGGIEETMDISLEECLRYALGNNPRIQAAMQDVFASDARIKQVWANYFEYLLRSATR